jgi:hypothetical protein
MWTEQFLLRTGWSACPSNAYKIRRKEQRRPAFLPIVVYYMKQPGAGSLLAANTNTPKVDLSEIHFAMKGNSINEREFRARW